MFDTGLNRRQIAIFKNKRLFSIVLIENIPQLFLQLVYSIVFNNITAITIVASIFSIISIILSFLEYSFTRSILNSQSVSVIKLEITSQDIGNLSKSAFCNNIRNKRYHIEYEMSKLMLIDQSKIEYCRPVQHHTGVNLTFLFACNDSIQSSVIISSFKQQCEDGNMMKILFQYWQKNCSSIKTYPVIESIETKSFDAEAQKEYKIVSISMPTRR